MKIQHLCKSFDGRVVLDHVSLTLESGGTACLMAPSGRGKTTLLRCIAGLERPDSGQITDLPERIGYVFQEDRLCDGFSAVDNIRLVTGRAMDEGEICRHLKELGLADSLGQPVRELSGGMRRRVSIGRAVCFGAGLLLLDEPFNGLDDATRQQTADYILRHRSGAAILCVTHDREDAAALGGAERERDAGMKRLILIGGAMGAGKTAVSRELLRLLPEAVWLDGDWCWRMDPFRVSEARKRMALDNITHLLGNFLDDEGYENVIFCWVMDRREIVEAVLAPLAGREFQLFHFSLVCAPGTLEERRTALIARWRGSGKCDVDLIQRVCDSWKNGEISVGFAKGVVLLTFIGAYGIPAPAELAALQEAVDRVIPCHLASKYLWRWILVREIEGMTLDELQTHKISEFAFEEVQA